MKLKLYHDEQTNRIVLSGNDFSIEVNPRILLRLLPHVWGLIRRKRDA